MSNYRIYKLDRNLPLIAGVIITERWLESFSLQPENVCFKEVLNIWNIQYQKENWDIDYLSHLFKLHLQLLLTELHVNYFLGVLLQIYLD